VDCPSYVVEVVRPLTSSAYINEPDRDLAAQPDVRLARSVATVQPSRHRAFIVQRTSGLTSLAFSKAWRMACRCRELRIAALLHQQKQKRRRVTGPGGAYIDSTRFVRTASSHPA
jgi:hypothetical protein